MRLIINMIFLYALILMVVPNSVYSSSYDYAAYTAQKGDWQDAHAQFNNMVTNQPDSADIMYDAGVAAYNLGNFNQSVAYFARSAELAQHNDKNLQFRAYFNAGNACVDDKNLHCALEQYDKALALEPDNEYARHNRDHVAQMLQQQQQDAQNKDDKENKDDKKNQQQQDQQKQNQSGDDQQNKQNQQSGDNEQQQNGNQKNDSSGERNDKQQGEGSQQDLNQKSKSEQGDGAEKGDKDTQRKEHGDHEQQQQKNADDNKNRNSDHELDKEAQDKQDKSENKQGDKHRKAPTKKEQEVNDKTNASVTAGQDGEEDGDDKQSAIAINDPWLLQVLDNQEQKDKAINKQLMEARVRQHQQGGKNGQNCW